jgi:iron complex outermembrane receptor protein
MHHALCGMKMTAILLGRKRTMSVTYKSLIKATVAISSLCFANNAYAQDSAEEAAGNANDIIVSARRIEERLQDVPISVLVVNQDQLSKANISSADELVRIIPGLNVESRYSSETNAFAIRGFNQALRTTAAVGTYFGEVVAPRGGAGAFPGGDGAGPGNLFDLQNVQVLKGPQGTLFGRNTTGGAVMLVPQKPKDTFEGYVQTSFGNYDMFQIQGVVNVPLASWARLRLGIDHQKRDGTLNNISGIGPKTFNDVDYYAVRGSLVLDLTPDIENYTIVSYSKSDHVGAQPQIYRSNPFAAFGGPTLAGGQVARLLASGDPYQIENNMSNPRSLTKQFQVINTTKWNVSDTLTIRNIMSYSSFEQSLNQSVFGTNWKGVDYVDAVLRPAFLPPSRGGNILSLSPSINARVSTAQAFNGEGQFGNDQRSFTEELQIQGYSGDGKLQYQAGLYFEHSTPGNPTNNESISVGAVCLVGAYTGLAGMRCLSNTGASVNQTINKIEYINKAAYAQATYSATDQLKLTAGFRITNDVTNASNQAFQWNFVGPNYLGAPGTLLSIPLSAFVAPTLGTGAAACQASNRPFASADPATNCLASGAAAGLRTESTRPTWTLSAAYNPSSDVMVYGTYSRGYRQGSAAPAAVGAKTSFDPETVDSFELGAKTSWNGSVSGRLNATAFYSKLKDYQVLIGLSCTRPAPPIDIGCPAGGSATSVFNAGKAHMYGIEFDGSLRPSDFFRVDFSGAWVRSRVDAFEADVSPYIANFNTQLNTATVGDALPLTPEFSGNVSATFTLPIPESAGKLEFAATYRYADSFVSVASNANAVSAAALLAACGANCRPDQIASAAVVAADPVDRGSAIKQIDLNLDWRDVGGQPVDLSFFVTNLTKQVTYTVIQPQLGGFGMDLRYIGQPRMFGARLRVRFGN